MLWLRSQNSASSDLCGAAWVRVKDVPTRQGLVRPLTAAFPTPCHSVAPQPACPGGERSANDAGRLTHDLSPRRLRVSIHIRTESLADPWAIFAKNGTLRA